MATPDSDMDKIRLKRLAKLQSSRSTPVEQAQKQTEPSPAGPSEIFRPVLEQQKPTTTTTPTTPPTSITPSRSFIQKQGIEGYPENASPAKKAKPAEVVAQPPQTPPSPSVKKAPEDWEDKALGIIFRISVHEQPANGHYQLKALREELESEGEPVRLSTGILDQAILSVCSSSHLKIPPFDHLLASWKRAVNYQRNLRPIDKGDENKITILAEAKRMALCYAQYCITMPEMFESVDASVRLEDKLLLDNDEEGGLPLEFFNALIGQFEEDPMMEEAFAAAIPRLSQNLNHVDFSTNYKPYLSALGRIISSKPLAKLFYESPAFLPEDVTGNTIETNTLLGPFFKLSPLQPKVLDLYFSGFKGRTQVALNDTKNALQLSLKVFQEQLHNIIFTLIRVSPEARLKVLDFFATTMNLNVKRTALQVDSSTVASDGFMLNITAILIKISTPFIDTNLTKIGKAEVEYFRRNPRLKIDTETKINADESASEEYYSNQIAGENNFISEIFFLTTAALHYGLGAAIASHEQLARDISEMEKHLQSMAAERVKWINTPQLVIFDRQYERLRVRLDKGQGYLYGLEIILCDNNAQTGTLLFLRFLSAWILRLVSNGRDYPEKPMSLPLNDKPYDAFAYLPEYFLETIGLIYGFVGRYLPGIVISNQVEELLTFCITFLGSTTYIRNPHLKSKLVEILYYGIQPNRSRPNGILGDAINGHQFALQHLMHSLMNFYIEIESQYYQKFTVRYHISEIIKKMWDNHSYRKKLEMESKTNPDFFIRFVALLLNDVTYVMDHSLTALVDINRLQHDLEESTTLSQQDRTEKEKELVKAEREAQSYVTLGNETVAMLRLFTAALANAFVQPEIVHRLAGMLDYNLNSLVGPKCSTLKVRNPEKYGFAPKILVQHFADVYLNLKHKPAFIEAIAKDGRSYRPEIFESLLNLLARFELKSKEERVEIAKMAADVEAAKRMEEEGEEELGDIPDEFLDPLMCTLMEDPVILPASKVTIDRDTIKTHLLSDPKDPFNRAPLKIEEVVPNTELKERITAFIREKRRIRVANVDGDKPSVDHDQMEVDVDADSAYVY
ncbi:ubiquitin elongating factor core-domain-containing protein [Peziza echinospora]|nr:ubiquitin elongating factor core-domain-containing protein [Peziza echinospora]